METKQTVTNTSDLLFRVIYNASTMNGEFSTTPSGMESVYYQQCRRTGEKLCL